MLYNSRIIKPSAFTFGDARLDRYYKACKNAAARTRQLYAESQLVRMDEAALLEIREELKVLVAKLEDWRAKVFRRREECEREGIWVAFGEGEADLEGDVVMLGL